jgi:hypothetical protein
MKKTTLCFTVLTACGAMSVPAMAADSLSDAIKNGESNISARLRYEDVDQDGKSGTDATTLRSRLNYKTADYKGFTAFVELDHVLALGSEHYNTAPNDKSYPNKAVIADPEYTQINQRWLRYSADNTDYTYGRQRINLDNQRHVGGVGFRQNEQTYDGFSIVNKSVEDLTVNYHYVTQVNRIFDEDSTLEDHDTRTHLLNLAYSGLENAKVSGYYYEADNDTVGKFSTTTVGVRVAGTCGDDNMFGYTAEFAKQTDNADNTRDYSANYYLLESSVALDAVTIKAGYEVLGADGDDGEFITPLATLHKFQGWTDKFLNKGAGNITGGIQDAYISVSGKVADVKLSAVYHDFESDDSSASGMDELGSEWGVSASKSFNKKYGVSVKYADYSADDFSADTKKLWVTGTVKF